MNTLELIQYLLDEIKKNETLMIRVDACYPAGPIRDRKLDVLEERIKMDKLTIDILSADIVASIAA